MESVAKHESLTNSESHFLRMPLEMRKNIYHLLIPSIIPKFCQKWWRWNNLPQRQRKHLAILRTNRQIYQEATSILYKESRILLLADDIFCLPSFPKTDPLFSYNSLDEQRDPNATSWRYDPLLGTGDEVDGKQVYSQPELGGLIEPHVLAQFQHVVVNISLLLRGSNTTQVIFDEGQEGYSKSVLAEHTRILRTELFKKLTQVLSNSPVLKTLTILLSVDAGTPRKDEGGNSTDDDDDTDPEPEPDDEDEEMIECLRQKRILERDRDVDVLIQSGVLWHLKGLRSVVELRTPAMVEE
ncbi:hypothetical protein HYALB_00010897 [Hymenoscyphus albidus]|uniref:Uncharacterized protein n=1 Tax=Hymenoscyphus albidus TaxID=595503 RepID=A0A9N9LQ23_9HELO|nr:hypothetical protein HYALB_00010897 [Hymenoscyphus albidus]